MRAEPIILNKDVVELLTKAGLPVSDLSSSPNLHLLGIHEYGQLIGVVGIEIYGEVGLLRSLAVAPNHRNIGLGVLLAYSAESRAAELGAKILYLLTTTETDFFAKLGYETIARSGVPAAIAATTQFVSLCPASSKLMRKVLAANKTLKDAP